MTGEIKACPFCGGMADWAGKETTGYRVACVCCDARGTWGDYGYQALTAWNTRPIEDELAASRDRASDACASVQRERDELREEVERLRKLALPQWFYYGNECSSDRCRDSIHECVDEDFLWDNQPEGSHVLEISTATNLPTIWAAVHFFTGEEKAARQDDEEYEIAEFASKDEASAFLSRYEGEVK